MAPSIPPQSAQTTVRLAVFCVFCHVSMMSMNMTVMPEILLKLVGGSSEELAKLVGNIAMTTAMASVVVVPWLCAVAETTTGRRTILLMALALDLAVELLLVLEGVRSSIAALYMITPIRAMSSVIMPMCFGACSSNAGTSKGGTKHSDDSDPEEHMSRGYAETKGEWRHSLVQDGTEGTSEGTSAATREHEASAGTRFGILGSAVSLGSMVGPMLGSYLYATDPRYVFQFGATLASLGFVLVMRYWPHDAPPKLALSSASTALAKTKLDPMRGIKLCFAGLWEGDPRRRRLTRFVVCFFIEHLGMAGQWSMVFPVARDRYGWDHTNYSKYMSFIASIGLVGKLVFLPLLLKLTKSRMNVGLIVVGLALRAAELLILAIATEGWMLFAAGTLWSFSCVSEPLLRAVMLSCVLSSDTDALNGALSAILLLTFRGAGPFLFGRLFAMGHYFPFAVSAALFVAAAMSLGGVEPAISKAVQNGGE